MTSGLFLKVQFLNEARLFERVSFFSHVTKEKSFKKLLKRNLMAQNQQKSPAEPVVSERKGRVSTACQKNTVYLLIFSAFAVSQQMKTVSHRAV